MALINTGSDYTRSGTGFLTGLANKLSFIPGVGGVLSWHIGMFGSLIEGAGWLMRGKVLSAATVVAAGAVSNTVNAAASTLSATGIPLLYWGQLGSGVATGSSLGTHGRALTESVIGGVTGMLGVKPTVLRSYTAGIGSVPGAAQSGPGYYATRAAQERGQDPNAAWNNYRNGTGADHVSALEAARAQGVNAQRGV